jgi:RNA polymerase sigma-70 factor (ECF subfamily)
MNDTEGATDAFNRWRAGDEEAAKGLVELYSARLKALADKNLSARLGPRVDGEDIVQSAFRTFFRRSVRGEFHIDSAADLWRLLVKITVAKARTHARHHTAQSRDVKAEASGSEEAWFYQAVTEEPGPLEAAVNQSHKHPSHEWILR